MRCRETTPAKVPLLPTISEQFVQLAYGPDESDLHLAKMLGHVIDPSSGRCGCSWTPKTPSGVLASTQAANHIWGVVHEAKEHRATALGVELCMECKGSGASRITGVRCSSCDGCGLLGLEGVERAAIAGGHEPVALDGCLCGHDGPWRLHASLVGKELLASLHSFEADLASWKADHRG